MTCRTQESAATQTTNDQRCPDYDEAFAQRYQEYNKRIFGYVYNRVNHNVDVAEDLTAEVFERAYTRGHQLRDANAYLPWLYTIARNRLAEHYRRQTRSERGLEKLEAILPVDDTVSPDDFAITRELAAEVRSHIEDLSERKREMLSLKLQSQLSHGEIARMTGASPNLVRVTIFRALKAIRESMANGDPAESEMQQAA